jgi:hypothetical protein
MLEVAPWHWQVLPMCAADGYRFSHIAGTDLRKHEQAAPGLVRVAHLMLVSKKGMSALQIMRTDGLRFLQNRLVYVPSHPRRAGRKGHG